jgi:hypothetical protein
MIKLRRMRLEGYLAYIRQRRNACGIMVGQPEESTRKT